MSAEIKSHRMNARCMAYSALAWMVCALLLCFVCAVAISKKGIGDDKLGYISSVISFVAACAAGAVFGNGEGKALIKGGVLGLGLCLVLLTVGTILSDHNLDSSQVLSVVCFTMTGCLAGAVFFGNIGQKKRYKLKPGVRR